MSGVSSCGKWVLSGEHAVLQGEPAIVLPDFSVTMEWVESAVLQPDLSLRERVLDLAHEMGQPSSRVGYFEIQSTIPSGSGRGSSAALSTCAVNWILKCAGQEFSSLDTWKEATRFENHFHGQSSGMDIAACVWRQGMYFVKMQEPVPLPVALAQAIHALQIELKPSGISSSTQMAIEQVQRVAKPAQYRQMGDQARAFLRADTARLPTFRESVCQSFDLQLGLYRQWGLIPSQLEASISEFHAQGYAVKMTGSGLGGYFALLQRQT